MACMNFGEANAYNVFLTGDHNQINALAEGRVAVGGSAVYQDYSVGTALPVSTTDAQLIIAGDVDIVRGFNNGNTIISTDSTITQYTMINSNGVTGQPLIDNVIDFAAIQAFLQCSSTGYAALPANGTVVNQFGGIVFTGTDPVLNIFTFNGNDVDGSGLSLAGANSLNFVIPDGSFALANVTGNNVGFGSYGTSFNGTVASNEMGSRIIWNVPEATSFTHGNLVIVGSILAPFAVVTALGSGQLNGQLIAASYNGNNNSLKELFYPFGGCLPDVCAAASLTVTKSAQGAPVFTGVPGTPLTFDFVIQNTGTETLTNLVIIDDLVGFNQTLMQLGPGQQYSSQFNSVVRDGRAGESYDNIVVVSSDQTAVQQASATVVIAALPIDVRLIKEVSKSQALPGEEVEYTVLLVNNGNSDLLNATLTDRLLGVNQSIGSVFDGLLLSLPFKIPVTAVPGSVLVNTSRLTASNLPAPGYVEASVSVLVTETPSLSLFKQANVETALPGDTINYSLTVANNSVVTTLTNLQLTDTEIGFIKTIDSIPPDSNIVYNQSFTIPADTPAGEVITNTAILQSSSAFLQATETVVIGDNPQLIVTKGTTNDFASPGDTITYTISLFNAGNTTLSNIRLTDALTGLDQTIPFLNIGETLDVTTSYTIPAGAPSGTQITNQTAAQAESVGTVTAIAVVMVSQNPVPPIPPGRAELRLTGFADQSTVFPDQTIVFSATLTNVSGISVRNILLQSPLFRYTGLLERLFPGQSFTIEGQYLVAPETPAGTIVTGSLLASSSQTPPAQVSADVIVKGLPQAEVTLTANRHEVVQGELVNLRVLCINTGNVDLTNVVIADFLIQRRVQVPLFRVQSWLEGRAQVTIQDAPGSVITETVTLTADEVAPIQSSVSITVFGLSVRLTVNRSFVMVGDQLQYIVGITNPSPATAVSIVVSQLLPALTSAVEGSLRVNGMLYDSNQLATGVAIGDLSPGSSAVVTYSVTVEAEPPNDLLIAQAAASFFYPSTVRQLRGTARSERVAVTVEENEE